MKKKSKSVLRREKVQKKADQPKKQSIYDGYTHYVGDNCPGGHQVKEVKSRYTKPFGVE